MPDAAYSSLFPATLERRVALGRAHEALELLYHLHEMPPDGPLDLLAASNHLRPGEREVQDRAALMLTAQATLDARSPEAIHKGLDRLAGQLEAIAQGDEIDRKTLRGITNQIAALRDSVIASRSEPRDSAALS